MNHHRSPEMATTARIFHVLLLITSLLFLNGCATTYRAYTDPTLSSDKVARIVGNKIGNEILLVGMNEVVIIQKVDRKNVYGWWIWGGGTYQPRDVYVLPGKHNILVNYQHYNWYAYGDLWLVTEAGHTYTVKAELRGHGVRFWIEDSDGKVVGGITGSVDEPATRENPSQPSSAEPPP